MTSKTIAEKRIDMDELDKSIIDLLVRRFDLAKEISALKEKDNMDNYDPKREDLIFKNIERILCEKDEKSKLTHIEKIYVKLLDESKFFQSK